MTEAKRTGLSLWLLTSIREVGIVGMIGVASLAKRADMSRKGASVGVGWCRRVFSSQYWVRTRPCNEQRVWFTVVVSAVSPAWIRSAMAEFQVTLANNAVICPLWSRDLKCVGSFSPLRNIFATGPQARSQKHVNPFLGLADKSNWEKP
jgi:hypothetical protein